MSHHDQVDLSMQWCDGSIQTSECDEEEGNYLIFKFDMFLVMYLSMRPGGILSGS